MNEESKVLWDIVQTINKSWTSGDVETLDKYYHQNIIGVKDNYELLSDSKESLLKSYHEFCNKAVVNNFEESEPIINIVGATAILSYTWIVEYQMNDKTFNEKGKEVLVFSKESGEWLVVWRMLVPEHEKQ